MIAREEAEGAPLWIRGAPIAGGALLAVGLGLVVEQLSTVWVDSVASGKPWQITWAFAIGLLLASGGLVWCILVSIRRHPSDQPSYEAILARLGFALVVAGLLNFIGLFGLASRDLLLAVVRPTGSEVAAAQTASAKPGKDTDGLPSGLEYLTKESVERPESAGRMRVVWAARMSLLPGFAVLGSMFFVCGSLQRKRSENEDDADDATYSSERFWSGFWYRMGEGILFGLVAFLASYAGFLDGVGEKSWSGLLLLLGLLMAMFVKPAEQLVNGLALQLFEAVSTFTKRTLKDGPVEKAIDQLTPVVQRLNDPGETIRLQAVRELEQLAKTRYEDVVDTLAAFLRQQSGRPNAGIAEDVQRAFIALGSIKAPRGKARRTASLRDAKLQGISVPDSGLDLSDFDLSGADLVNAQLKRSRLTGVQLSNARLEGANLGEAIDVDKARLKDARYDRATLFPNAFDPVAAGMQTLVPTPSQSTER